MTLMTHVRESVQEQDRVVAMENCFATWDGNIDLTVIQQGLMERLSQFEGFEFKDLGIALTRTSRTQTRIDVANMQSGEIILTSTVFLTLGSIVGNITNYLSHTEESVLCEWLGRNIH